MSAFVRWTVQMYPPERRMELTASKLDSTILDCLKQDRQLREGHFQYQSGCHSEVLLDRDRLLADSRAASQMGYALAKAFFTRKIDTVAAPSVWGAGLAQWVAYFLEPRAKVVYATPMLDGSQQIAPNLLDLIEGKRVLLIDNLMLSGETMAAFDAQVTRLGGNVLGIGCLWVAGNAPAHDGEVIGLLNDRYPSYSPGHCPLCQDGHEPPEIVPY